MIWNHAELFNVEDIEVKPNGSVRMLRFPKPVMDVFGHESGKYPIIVGRMTTGCEIRFVCEDADVFVTAEDIPGRFFGANPAFATGHQHPPGTAFESECRQC